MFNPSDLDHFTGTEHWYKTMFHKVSYTDGVQYVAEKAQAYWLIDEIAAAQFGPALKEQPFQVWTLTVTAYSGVASTGDIQVTDGNDKVIYKQSLPFTDFPAPSITLWVEDGGPDGGRVILLPSEH